jgi:hypothetical protein
LLLAEHCSDIVLLLVRADRLRHSHWSGRDRREYSHCSGRPVFRNLGAPFPLLRLFRHISVVAEELELAEQGTSDNYGNPLFGTTAAWAIAAQFGQPWMTPPVLAFAALLKTLVTQLNIA